MEKKLIKKGSTDGRDCIIYCVHHVSLSYKTEPAKFERKELPPFSIMVSVLTKIISRIKLFTFFINKN